MGNLELEKRVKEQYKEFFDCNCSHGLCNHGFQRHCGWHRKRCPLWSGDAVCCKHCEQDG